MDYYMGYLRMIGTTALLSGAALGGALYYGQDSLIYPASVPEGSRTEVATPAELDLPYEEIWLTTPDNVKLHSYFILQGGRTQGEREMDGNQIARNYPTILYFHANAGNVGHRLPIARVFYSRMNCNVVMLSYRGYGKSEGSPSEKGIRIDSQTVLDFIRAYPSIKDTKLILYGQSLGGAVCVDLASRNQHEFSGMILENTFLSMPRLVPSIMPVARVFVPLLKSRWDSASSISTIDTSSLPTLFLSGRDDTLIPPAHMDELYELCGKDHDTPRKRFESFVGGNHNDTCTKPKYFTKILQFIRDEIAVAPLVRTEDGQVEKSTSASTSHKVEVNDVRDTGSESDASTWEKVSAANNLEPAALDTL